ncbi:MAG TPA: hypothetical protein VFH88_10375 [Candidatus Krumholzibacteria bacterium]|nr:hypothetical protein [Candidatus Krumholzibacteria bacterium]
MMKKWSRIALASFLVLMIGASVASATTARVRSLANTGDYISDDSAVNRWYSTLPSFGNQVNAEMGMWDGASLTDTRGLSWITACGENGKWGTYRISLNENALDHPGFWMGNPFYSGHLPGSAANLGAVDPNLAPGYQSTPMNKWDIAGGWELSDAVALGVSVTQSKWNAESSAVGFKASNSFLSIGAGFSWTNNDKLVFDASATFGSASGDSKIDAGGGATTAVEWDSKTAFDIAARLFYDWKDNVTLVPVAEFATSNYSLQDKSTPTSTPIAIPNGDKNTDFMLGLGMNMDVNQSNMIVFALEYMHRQFEYSNGADAAATGEIDKITTQYMPTVRLALETQITSWFTTRVGAAKYMVTSEEKFIGGDKNKITQGTPTFDPNQVTPNGFDWFLGCGFNIAEWTIDMELASETPFNVGYWLTGYSNYATGAGPVTHIAAVWNY